jgi:hypothetical protein
MNMADIELVIKIPEELYVEYVNIQLGRGNGKGIVSELLTAIKNGTPLPKNHGDLKDMDEIIEKIRKLPNAGVHWFINAESVFNTILDAPTIIEGK